jgi:uncharacterized protein
MIGTGKKILLILIRAYKWGVSPMLAPACRYVPTCSEYAGEAVDRHGALRGAALAIRRLLRCHPFARGGFDPVPLRAAAGVQARLSTSHEIFALETGNAFADPEHTQ